MYLYINVHKSSMKINAPHEKTKNNATMLLPPHSQKTLQRKFHTKNPSPPALDRSERPWDRAEPRAEALERAVSREVCGPLEPSRPREVMIVWPQETQLSYIWIYNTKYIIRKWRKYT